jgi:hypothetical protein
VCNGTSANGSDAGAPDASPPDAGVASDGAASPILYQGGPITGHVQVVGLFFNDFPYAANVSSIWRSLLDGGYLSWLGEYDTTFPGGTNQSIDGMGGYVPVQLTTPSPVFTDVNQATQFLQNLLATDPALPSPSANTLYVIYYPETTTLNVLTGSACSTAASYVRNVVVLPGSAGANVSFALVALCSSSSLTPVQQLSYLSSAVVLGEATDPFPTVPAWQTQTGNDIAEYCASAAPTTYEGLTVSTGWSNLASRCR